MTTFKAIVGRTAALLALGLVLGLGAAQAAPPLRVGTNAEYAPFEFMDANKSIIGFDIDIIQAIARSEGIEIEIVNMDFDDLGGALQRQEVNAVIAALSITPERLEKYDFSDAYYASGQSIVVRSESAGRYKTASDLAGAQICVLVDSTASEVAGEISPGGIRSYPSQPEAFAGLEARECEAVINDRPVNQYFIASTGRGNVTELSEVLSAEDYGIAVAKGNSAVLKQINDGLRKIRSSGEFVRIHRKWFAIGR